MYVRLRAEEAGEEEWVSCCVLWLFASVFRSRSNGSRWVGTFGGLRGKIVGGDRIWSDLETPRRARTASGCRNSASQLSAPANPSFVIKMRAAQEAALRGETMQSPTLNSSLLGSVGSSNMSHNFSGGSVFSPSTSTSTSEPARPKPRAKRPKATPYPSFPVPLIPPLPANPFDPGSSSSHPAQPPRPMSSFAFSPKTNSFSSGSGSDAANAFGTGSGTGLEWLDSMLEGTAMGSLGSTGMEGFNWDQANLLAYESPEHALMNIGTGSTATPQFGSGSSSSTFGPPSFSSGPTTVPGGNIGMGIPGAMAHAASLHSAIKAEPQLEDVTSWANISHFISLFLQYLYPLLPLVHRPTFAEHLATRRDLRDTDFRALLLSIGASLSQLTRG